MGQGRRRGRKKEKGRAEEKKKDKCMTFWATEGSFPDREMFVRSINRTLHNLLCTAQLDKRIIIHIQSRKTSYFIYSGVVQSHSHTKYQLVYCKCHSSQRGPIGLVQNRERG